MSTVRPLIHRTTSRPQLSPHSIMCVRDRARSVAWVAVFFGRLSVLTGHVGAVGCGHARLAAGWPRRRQSSCGAAPRAIGPRCPAGPTRSRPTRSRGPRHRHFSPTTVTFGAPHPGNMEFGRPGESSTTRRPIHSTTSPARKRQPARVAWNSGGPGTAVHNARGHPQDDVAPRELSDFVGSVELGGPPGSCPQLGRLSTDLLSASETVGGFQ